MNTLNQFAGKCWKNFSLLTAFIALMVMGFEVQAQLPANTTSDELAAQNNEAVKEMAILNFTARFVEGTVYLNWVMKGEQDNSVFLVERSVGDGDFVSLGVKDGFAAPNSETSLLYCFSDTNPEAGSVKYRIRQYRSDGILYSPIVTVVTRSEIPLVQVDKP